MGENPKKYHVTDEGDVYRINDDGSFTSMGNAEKMSESNTITTTDSVTHTATSNDKPTKPFRKRFLVIGGIVFMFLAGVGLYITYISNNIGTPIDTNITTDSIMAANVPVKTPSVERIDTTYAQNSSSRIVESINKEIKQDEQISEESHQTKPLDMPELTNDDYTMQLACGQMEGQDNFFVLFPDGKTHLCSAHKRRIDRMLQNLNTYSDYKIAVDGYRSSFTGTHASNMEDAQLRVNSIVGYLKSKGISDNSIIVGVHDLHIDYFGRYGHVSIIVE